MNVPLVYRFQCDDGWLYAWTPALAIYYSPHDWIEVVW